jgi:hypothetical protein
LKTNTDRTLPSEAKCRYVTVVFYTTLPSEAVLLKTNADRTLPSEAAAMENRISALRALIPRGRLQTSKVSSFAALFFCTTNFTQASLVKFGAQKNLQ